MFKPIKSFLMYLQTSGVFGTNVNMDDETPIDSEKVISHEEEFGEDPLLDPLALDESSQNVSGEITLQEESNEQLEEDNILFVDIDVIRNGRCDAPSDAPVEEEPMATLDIEDGEARSEGSDSGLGLEPNGGALLTPGGAAGQPQKTAMKRRSSTATDGAKRCRRSIQFGKVTEYLFPRTQGFMCVPTKGGCTLGMSSRHAHVRSFSLSEAAEQRRMHKLQRLQLLNPRHSSSEDTDSEDEPSENSSSDPDMENYDCLQPMTSAKRRKLLKEAGVKIEPSEKNVCDVIRVSRKLCGCDCKGYCDPDTCSCSQAEIKCQVDKPDFPCGCTHDGCANLMGRVEFNSDHVRTHYIHTMMRLELEQRQLVEEHEEEVHVQCRQENVAAPIDAVITYPDLMAGAVAIDEPRIPHYDFRDQLDNSNYLPQPDYPTLGEENVAPSEVTVQYPDDMLYNYRDNIGQYSGVEEQLSNPNYLPQSEYPPKASVNFSSPHQLIHLTPNMYEEERFPCTTSSGGAQDFTNVSSNHQISYTQSPTHPCPLSESTDHLFEALPLAPPPAFSTVKELLNTPLPYDV